MNSETVALIERPYQDVVDDILTAIVGGVVNEPIIFDVKTDAYPLAEPARGIRGVTGHVEGNRHSFQKEIDFGFSEGDNTLVWTEEGKLPDDESVFYVDYFRREARSPISDLNVGSVTRTLSEAIGREVTTVYQQINRAYLSAFVDKAEGKSLDLVVSILDIERFTKDYAVGLVTFFRDPQEKDSIHIKQGILLSANEGEVLFETRQPRTLQQGQVRIDVPVRATEQSKGEVGKVDAGAITELAQPLAGISHVTNIEPTFLGAEDESDDELRARAKAALRALGKGTLAALAKAIFEARADLLEVFDPNSPPDKRSDPGTVTLLVSSEPERFPSLQASVHETRAAGIMSTVIARYVFFKPRITAQIKLGITAAGKAKVVAEIIAALGEYVDALKSGEPAEGTKLIEAIEGVEDVKEPKIVDVMAWRSDLSRPGAESLVAALLEAVAGAPAGDEDALRSAMTRIITEAESPVPSGRRIPDRSLVQDSDGNRATDDQIDAGEFQVVAVVDGEDWWVALDIEAADIVLTEN